MLQYFNVNELSEYIHLSSSSIYKKTSLRQIPFIKSGKKLLFKRDMIDAWLAGQYCPTKEELENNISKLLKTTKNG